LYEFHTQSNHNFSIYFIFTLFNFPQGTLFD